MQSFYSQDELDGFHRAYRLSRVYCVLFVLIALGVCAALCACVKTANSVTVYIAVSIVTQIASHLYWWLFRARRRRLRAEYLHVRNILSQPLTAHTGVLCEIAPIVGHGYAPVPGGLKLRRLVLKAGDEKKDFYINERKLEHLPPPGSRVTLYTAGMFAAGCEDGGGGA